ncbi:Response regulator PleD [Planktothrix tepida]|uniref:PAS/PAC and GAF sensors-containing diguanylate cyclase n=1 Tax=Planktothrix tepida PCC 9214 TaxID=671072 RepID=A0A1J1LMD7_9CYAN|nr:GGDEF domain-containing protein [Planktothrix tepida]CAD5981059.1 Response regulator PleD [Planktothrix tepida]CUR33733.1 PAS/PAC and GAF sensors-containing diguanylate cyclase [Planktothrix tepida PCC 9214]
MQQTTPHSLSELFLETEKLSQELEILKREKLDLEILLEATTVHADLVESQLYESNRQLHFEIRERKLAEAKLKASERQLRLLLETVSQANHDLRIILETATAHGDFIEEYTHNLSIRDPLTGLFNRRYQEKSLDRHLKYAQEHQQVLSVIMIDIDYFKRFNDKWGHQVGDVVLQEISQFLIDNIRQSDIACRYGGEELMLILPRTSLEEAKNLAEKLRSGVERLRIEKHDAFWEKLTISLGIASFPVHGLSSLQLTESADAALYEAKAKGRNCAITANELLL